MTLATRRESMMMERFTVRLVLDPQVSMAMLDEVAHLGPALESKGDGTVVLEVAVSTSTQADAVSYVRGRLRGAGADGCLAAA